MSEMFNNYPQPEDYIPNNRPIPCCHKDLEIMAGETTSHSFELFFDVDEYVDYYEVIYKLGNEVVLTKTKDDCTLFMDNGKSIIVSPLSVEDTLLFANTLLSAKVQIKLNMKDLSTLYTDIYPIKLKTVLDK